LEESLIAYKQARLVGTRLVHKTLQVHQQIHQTFDHLLSRKIKKKIVLMISSVEFLPSAPRTFAGRNFVVQVFPS
jgi:hypothetical protein